MDETLKKDRDDSYDEASQLWSETTEESYKNLKFYVGDQWSNEDKISLREQGRNAYVFNHARRIIKMASGFQRKNRLSSICQPVENSDDYTAELLTDCLIWQMQYEDGYNILSDAFEKSLVTSQNLISVYMDHSKDLVNGDIKMSREPYNSYLLDPYFTKRDLTDCRYLMRRRFIDKNQGKMLLPDSANDIDKLPVGINDNKFNYMSYSRKDRANLLAYDEYWRQTTKKKNVLIDKLNGENTIWKGSDSQLKEFLIEYPWITSQKTWVPCIELAVFVQDELMWHGDNPYDIDCYPFVPVICFYEPEYDDYKYKMQGLMSCMRDAQEEFNKTRSSLSDILRSQANSGWIVKSGSVTNKADLYKTGQGVVIERTISSEPSDLTKIPAGDVPPGLPQFIEALASDIIQLTGANEELLGITNGSDVEISGVLAKMRAYNAVTTMQDIFDNFSFSQKLLGNVTIKMIQSNWEPEKIERITGKKVSEEFYNKNFGKYDCVVKEGLLTDTQRQLAYAQGLAARQAGINIPDQFFIDNITIANESGLKEAYAQEAEAAKAQQAAAMEQEELLKGLEKSKIISDLSLAAERRGRMVADTALARERVAAASLDRAKTVSEIAEAGAKMKEADVNLLSNQIQQLSQLMALEKESQSMDVKEAVNEAYQEVQATSDVSMEAGMQPGLPIPTEESIPG